MPIINTRILKNIKSIGRSYSHIRHSYFNSDLPESVYFYTFHKCASTLFGGYVLKNIDRLYHADYASQIYSGERSPHRKITFRERGFIYGPIRISADETGPVGRILVKPTIDHNFIRDKVALFFVRDPRDILVSSYYSFGFTHGLSVVDELRRQQTAKRESIRDLTLDEYVLQSVEHQVKLFNELYRLSTVCKRSCILRYEDMIDDFDAFTNQLLRYISVRDSVLQKLYDASRPKITEDTGSHRRSGQVQSFRRKLDQDTIDTLNLKLADTLALFGYI